MTQSDAIIRLRSQGSKFEVHALKKMSENPTAEAFRSQILTHFCASRASGLSSDAFRSQFLTHLITVRFSFILAFGSERDAARHNDKNAVVLSLSSARSFSLSFPKTPSFSLFIVSAVVLSLSSPRSFSLSLFSQNAVVIQTTVVCFGEAGGACGTTTHAAR